MSKAIKLFIFNLYIQAFTFWVWLVSFNHYRVRRLIGEINAKARQPIPLPQLAGSLLLISSYRVDNKERSDIFKVGMPETLKSLAGGNLTLEIADASTKEYLPQTRQVLNQIPGINISWQPKADRLTKSYLDLLTQNSRKYFCIIFEDQPVYGLTPSLLSAAVALLEDFAGLVEIISIDSAASFNINEQQKSVSFKPQNLEFIARGKKPLGIVSYGQHRFAILRNFHYGFFFNVLISNSADYARRLKWYMDNVSQDEVHDIEKAGMYLRGPIYKYIAVPLDAFMFNIDFAHTESSVRGTTGDEHRLYEALRKGFVIEPEKL